jgi:hypothetical protein
MYDQNIDQQKKELEIKKLNLEIENLKKPEFYKFSTWTSLVAVVIAFAGVIGQNILSSIKSENAKFEVNQANSKRDSALTPAFSVIISCSVSYKKHKLSTSSISYTNIY